MARLVIVLDVDANPTLWDPHEVVEDILAHADKLPTFGENVPFTIPDERDGDIQRGTFISAEWEKS